MRAVATGYGWIVIVVCALSTLAPGLMAEAPSFAQTPERPLPKGRTIDARDGDTIVIDGDERIRIVRRQQAMARAIFNETGRWLILLADMAQADRDPDGRVDIVYNFRNVTGVWPLGARWEGQIIIEERSGYQTPGSGIVLRTGQGLVELMSGAPHFRDEPDPSAIAVLNYSGFGRGTSTTQTFDQAEERAIAELERNLTVNAERVRQGLPSMSTFSSEGPAGAFATSTLVGPTTTAKPATPPGPSVAAVRVGGSIRSPNKIHDVPPVLPEVARRAGVFGTIILELTIDVDGTVTSAKVLRSIPLLDKAAVDAARQWRYEPTVLNNQPIPVILTATVTFD